LSYTLISIQKDFDALKVSFKEKFSSIDEKEISILKTKISTLKKYFKKKYVFDKARLEAMFPKKHTPRKHVHVSYATHAHTHQAQHAHTHHAKHVTHNKHAHVSHIYHAFM